MSNLTIIVEGPDNSGKTSLIKRIKKELSKHEIVVDVMPSTGRPENIRMMRMKHETQMMFEGILDRAAFISEYVYSKSLSRVPLLHYEWFEEMHRVRPLIIYCRPDTKTILDNKDRSQMVGVINNHRRIIEEYDGIMSDLKNCGFNLAHYDFKDPTSFPNLMNLVNKQISENRHWKVMEKLCTNLY